MRRVGRLGILLFGSILVASATGAAEDPVPKPDDVAGAAAQPASNPDGPFFPGGDSGISEPKRIHYRAPTYPPSVRNRRLEAKITMQLTVLANGKVGNNEVLACAVKRSYEEPTHEFDQFCD